VRFVLANRDVRQAEQAGMGVEIFFNGHKHFITADRLQILNLLLSTYEAAIQRNKELSLTQQNLRDINSSLESANKDLEAFSHSVSHDLRAPVRAIGAFSQMLLTESESPLSEQDRHLVRNISRSAQQMGLMIESLLNLSRLGRHSLSKRLVSMTNLVQEVLVEQRDRREGRHVEVNVGTLPDCTADPMLVKQVWVNLMSNALKYTRKREKALIEVGYRPHGEESAYFVRDNGAGFDMQYAEKLFGVFQRLHSTEEFEGTGVGLSIVHRIVQRHGGRIWAEAEVDKGATFYFTLPGQRSSTARN
jgi:light-regulated signal transduction histidine kinase (bacteriophytochrome)